MACKSYLFTEGSLEVENKEHLFDFVVTLKLGQGVLERWKLPYCIRWLKTMKHMGLFLQMSELQLKIMWK